MDPNDIWAVPAVNTIGDSDPYVTFGAVGAALTEWERMEAHLSLVFVALIGLGSESQAAQRAYGTIVAFGGRAGMIQAAAEAYFAAHPDAGLAADLDRVVRQAKRAAARRNEIAHGIVQPIDPQKTVLTGGRYVLYPAYYAAGKRDLNHLPQYGYTSAEISRFGRQFGEMVQPIVAIIGRIHALHKART